MENTTILVDGKEAAKSDKVNFSKELGPYLPGKHTVKAVYQGDFGKLESEQAINMLSPTENKYDADLKLAVDNVFISSNYRDSDIYINGKKTGLKGKGDKAFGPLPLNGSMKVYAAILFPWGTAKSAEVPIDSSYMNLKIDPLTDILKERLMMTTVDFLNTMMYAMNSFDATKLRNLSPENVEEMKKDFETLKSSGKIYKGQRKSVTFDLNSIKLTWDGQYYQAQLKTKEVYDQVMFLSTDNPIPPTKEETQIVTYNLSYQNGKWIITGWYDGNNFDDSRTKVY
jgi:hypothetical protein